MKLLITDLDNTLYDWVTFFAKSFQAMVATLTATTGIPEKILLDDFKAVHQKYGNSEHPFAVLELASIRALAPAASEQQLLKKVDDALHEFNRIRAKTLRLYDGVAETLSLLHGRGIVVVGHTEATTVNAYFRVKKLGIEQFFSKLYALDAPARAHPKGLADIPPIGFIETVPAAERKPNPRLLLDICSRQGVSPSEAVYVGDSLTRDVSMATQGGVFAVWAEYGTHYDKKLWSTLVRVTHWSAEDVVREEQLRDQYSHVKPDLVIASFSELLPLFS